MKGTRFFVSCWDGTNVTTIRTTSQKAAEQWAELFRMSTIYVWTTQIPFEIDDEE